MQRDDKVKVEQQKEKSSTNIITDTLGMGGPPKKPPVFGKTVRVYDHDEEVKIDKHGRSYIGISIEELQKREALKKDVSSKESQAGCAILDKEIFTIGGDEIQNTDAVKTTDKSNTI